MSKIVAATTVIVGLFAALVALVPSLRDYVPVLKSSEPSVSEEVLELRALAAAQEYTPTTIFTDPLVVYLDNFLSETEIENLLNISSPLFTPSLVFNPDTDGPQHRTSSSCRLPQNEKIPSIVSERALQFLASLNSTVSYYGLENLQAVKYAPSQYYHHHVDHFDALIRDDIPGRGARGKGRGRFYNRVASFFLYLKDECTGGATEFPDLKWEDVDDSFKTTIDGEPDGTEKIHWAERVSIDKSGEGGITFKPRKGSGVFWVNLTPEGLGNEKVSHAGLPVEGGEKVGMNIWVKRDFGW